MNRFFLHILFSFIIIHMNGCTKKVDNNHPPTDVENQTSLGSDDERIQFMGRVDKNEDVTKLFWPGSSIGVSFYGTGIRIELRDFDFKDEKYRNFLCVKVDGEVKDSMFGINKEKKYYILADDLEEGNHTVEVVKINSMHPGYPRGAIEFFGFELIGKGYFFKKFHKYDKKIEFYGNSITCGASMTFPNSGESRFENNYNSYAAITARFFNAEYFCIAKSGVGLISGTTSPNMLQMYDLVNPFDIGKKWDFSKYTPDLVVINLLQNDAAKLQGEDDEYIRLNYEKFLSEIRTQYPDCSIICLLGPMNVVNGTRWTQIVKDAVNNLQDNKIYTLFFPYRGRNGHPLKKEHENMASDLIQFIIQELKW